MKLKRYKLYTNIGLIFLNATSRQHVKRYAKSNNEITSLYGIRKVV